MTFFDHPEWHERGKVAWFRSATRYSVRHAAAIICVSESTARRLREVLSPRAPVVAVAHGVDHARFLAHEPEPGADQAVLESLGLDRPYVLHLGTIEPRKGIDDLVAAFDLLAPGHPELELVLAGGLGWKAEAATRAIADARAGGRIRRLGYVPDDCVPSLLRRARTVAYPSLEEGFGLPALEALACGAPLVTTVGTAMAELAGDSALSSPRAGRTSWRPPSRRRWSRRPLPRTPGGAFAGLRWPPATPGRPARRAISPSTSWQPVPESRPRGAPARSRSNRPGRCCP